MVLDFILFVATIVWLLAESSVVSTFCSAMHAKHVRKGPAKKLLLSDFK